jgi:hypothetical protein
VSSRFVTAPILTACVVLLAASTQAQAIRVYKGRLSPVPIPAPSQTVVGVGSVTATLTGSTLDVAGTFEGLASPATEGRLHRSPKPGIRGPAVLELKVTAGTSGTLTGSVMLTPAQVQELSQGRYYVQLHSVGAPDGNLWGWLFAQENRK